MQIRPAAIALLAAVVAAGCTSAPPAPGSLALERSTVEFEQVGIDETRSDVTALVGAATRIGALLATPTAATDTTAVSPWSTLTFLGMVRAGAAGAAAEQLDSVGLGQAADLPAAMAALTGQVAQWADDPGAVPVDDPPAAPLFQSQVALLASEGYPIREQYLAELSASYGTGLYPVDFETDIAGPLGEWAAVNTASAVTAVPLRSTPDTQFAVAATAYLAAAWRYPFDPARTAQLPFATADGQQISVPTMRGTALARVAPGDGFTALQLDYGTGTLALQIMVPNPGVSLTEVAADGRFFAARLGLAAAAVAPVEVSLPTWRSSGWTSLVDPLRGLGVTDIFSAPSGLDAIADVAPVIADAQSVAVFSVAEKGTAPDFASPSEVAAAPGPTPGVSSFAVDRAFAYSVVDTATGLPLLMGTVSRPGG